MIHVRKIIVDERKYCTHCGDRAWFELNYLNPHINQQSSCVVLCDKCMGQLKKAVVKATSPNTRSTKRVKRSR